jgi:hypothetical protein
LGLLDLTPKRAQTSHVEFFPWPTEELRSLILARTRSSSARQYREHTRHLTLARLDPVEPWRLMPKFPLYAGYPRAALAHRHQDVRAHLQALRTLGTSRRELVVILAEHLERTGRVGDDLLLGRTSRAPFTPTTSRTRLTTPGQLPRSCLSCAANGSTSSG